MKHKIQVLLAMLLVSAAIWVSAPAYAGVQTTDPPPGGCNLGSMCLFENANYGGIKLEWLNPNQAHGCYTLGGGPLDNKVSSIINLTGHNVWFAQTTSCGGTGAWILAKTKFYPNLAGSGWNDVFSGFSVTTTP